MNKSTRFGIIAWFMAISLSLVGCGKKEEKPKYREVPGTVASINLETDEVSMWYFHPKQQKKIELKGRLAPDAEILINGTIAQLKDLHIDDKVKVVGRVENHGSQKVLIATQVQVTRPVEVDLSADTQPASG